MVEDSTLDLEGMEKAKGFKWGFLEEKGNNTWCFLVYSGRCFLYYHLEGRNEKTRGDYYLYWEWVLKG